jgi:hypothetical protein
VVGTVAMCVAKPKVGKGTYARNLTAAVVRGERFLGLQCKQGEVVYLAMEECEEDIKADFRAMGVMEEEAERIHIHAAAAPSDAVPKLVRLIERRRPVLLVVDPVILHPLQGPLPLLAEVGMDRTTRETSEIGAGRIPIECIPVAVRRDDVFETDTLAAGGAA